MDLELRPRGSGVVALGMAVLLVAGACSASATPTPTQAPTAAPTAAAATVAATAAPTIDVLAPYVSKTGTLPLIKFATSVPQMSFASFEIAKAMNFFEYQGVKTEFVQLQSGATALQAIQGGSIDLLDSAST